MKLCYLQLFTTKNIIDFIDGSISQLVADDFLLGIWTHCYNVVISWLLNVVTCDIVDSLLYIFTVVKFWNDLHQQFCQDNGPWVFHIKKYLILLNQGALAQNSLEWEEEFSTCSCLSMQSHEVMDTLLGMEYVMQFIMSLNDSYEPIALKFF